MKPIFAYFMFYFLVHVSYSQNVGIGTNTPNASAQLEISSTTKGLLIPRMTNTQMNAIVSPAPGLMVFNLTDSLMYVRKKSGWTKLVPSASGGSGWTANGNNIYNSNTGNIGIGTSLPAHARMEIKGTVGAAVAMFGADKYGVTIEADNPEIGFNYFYNNATKTIKAGYASVIGMDPGTGELYMGNFNGNQSAADFGDITGYRRNVTVFQNGEIRLAGSGYFNHFFFGSKEDTYIRGGKDFSNVYINDVNSGGRVGIGTTALEPQTILTIKGAQYFGGIDVTANGGPIGAIYAHGLNGTPALYLDGPLKVNTLSSNRTAYRLFPQSNDPNADGFSFGVTPCLNDAEFEIIINNSLTNNDPNVLIIYNIIEDYECELTFRSFLRYTAGKWRIILPMNKYAGDLFSFPGSINILIIKTN